MELIGQDVIGGAIVTRLQEKHLPADVNDFKEAVRRAGFLDDVDRMLRRARETNYRMGAPGAGYVVNTGSSAVALAAATAKTIMYINAGSAKQPMITEWAVGFDGVTSTAVPALVEAMFGTAATNSTPGTASTSFTPLQVRDWPAMAATCTAANTCTSEPTVLSSHRQYLVSPYGGLIVIQYPLGREPSGIVTASTAGKQLAIRCNAPAIVNTRGYLEFEE